MFTGFSQATQDFLWGLLLNNERPWFEAHRAEYQQHLLTPFRELALDTSDEMRKRFPDLSLTLHIARIYRDARRLHGRGPYKEHLWFSLSDTDWISTASFWFEIGAADFGKPTLLFWEDEEMKNADITSKIAVEGCRTSLHPHRRSLRSTLRFLKESKAKRHDRSTNKQRQNGVCSDDVPHNANT